MILLNLDDGLRVRDSNYLHFPNGARVHRSAVIEGSVWIGSNAVIRPGAVIGTPPEKDEFWFTAGYGVRIGNGTIVSDCVRIHSGANIPTIIGDNVRLLAGAHIGHDSWIGDGAVISCNVLVGGHSVVGKGANLGLGSVLHQFSNVGAYAMVGANSFVPKRKRIVPGNIYVGSPARFLKNNTIGLQRRGVTQEELRQAVAHYYEQTKDWSDAE